MKYWLIVLVLFSGLVHSQSVIDKTDPGYIRTMGTGKTVADAKADAFKNAISMRVGSAILSEVEVSGNKVVREDIVNYSAGYIDSHEIIKIVTQATDVTIIMDVIVRSSKIHERLLSKSKDEKKIDGASLATQYSTYITERKSGDALLATVLNDYPKRAFNVTQGKHEFKVDGNRNSVLIIPFDMRWNSQYLDAIKEALKVLEDGDRNSPSRVLVNSSRYNFNDIAKYDQVRNKFVPAIQIRANIIDHSNTILLAQCYAVYGIFSGTYSNGIYVIYGNERLKKNIQIDIDPQMVSALERAARVELAVTANCTN